MRKGDPRNDLWKQMLAIVAHLEPKAFLLENVPGMVYWKRGEFGAEVLDAFSRLGYAVSKEILLSADYGVPQRRRRLFLVGVLGDESFTFPELTHMGGWRRDPSTCGSGSGKRRACFGTSAYGRRLVTSLPPHERAGSRLSLTQDA